MARRKDLRSRRRVEAAPIPVFARAYLHVAQRFRPQRDMISIRMNEENDAASDRICDQCGELMMVLGTLPAIGLRRRQSVYAAHSGLAAPDQEIKRCSRPGNESVGASKFRSI
jgi:hypothetical protein